MPTLTREEWEFLVKGCFSAQQMQALIYIANALEASRTTGLEPELAIAAHVAVLVETMIAIVDSMPIPADFETARTIARKLVQEQLPDVLRAFSEGEGLHMGPLKPS